MTHLISYQISGFPRVPAVAGFRHTRNKASETPCILYTIDILENIQRLSLLIENIRRLSSLRILTLYTKIAVNLHRIGKTSSN